MVKQKTGMLKFAKYENIVINKVIKPTEVTVRIEMLYQSFESEERSVYLKLGDTVLDIISLFKDIYVDDDYRVYISVNDSEVEFDFKNSSLLSIDYVLPVSDIDYVFENCKELTYVSKKTFVNFTNVKGLKGTFKGCSKFDINSNEECIEVFKSLTSLTETFYGTAIKKPSHLLMNNDVFGHVMYMVSTFEHCYNITNLSIITFMKMNELVKLDSTFKNCINLKAVHQDMFRNLTKLRIVKDLFINTNITKVNKNFKCSLNPYVKCVNMLPSNVKVNEFI